jgi:hypothetical protein
LYTESVSVLNYIYVTSDVISGITAIFCVCVMDIIIEKREVYYRVVFVPNFTKIRHIVCIVLIKAVESKLDT